MIVLSKFSNTRGSREVYFGRESIGIALKPKGTEHDFSWDVTAHKGIEHRRAIAATTEGTLIWQSRIQLTASSSEDSDR